MVRHNLDNFDIIHQYEYGSGNTKTLARKRDDTPILYVFANGEFVDSVSLSQIKRLAEIDYELA